VTVIRQDSGLGLLGTPVTDVNSTSPAPRTGLDDTPADTANGDALYPVIGGAEQSSAELTASSLSLSGSTLTVTMKVADLRAATQAAQLPTMQATSLEYVTRWIMPAPQDGAGHQCPVTCYEIFYAGMAGNDTVNSFYAGPATSSDLCSVSACFPHVILYPESAAAAPSSPVNGHGETGTAVCPPTPSIGMPCTITITVNAADIGSPTNSSLLEEVGAYTFAVSHFQAAQTNAQSQADDVQLEIDGVCCYNFQASNSTVLPETPWTPALLVLGTALIGVGVWRRRRTSNAASTE
jgi:hypothetical protein